MAGLCPRVRALSHSQYRTFSLIPPVSLYRDHRPNSVDSSGGNGWNPMVRRLAATAAVTLCALAGAGHAMAATGDPPATADAAGTVQLDAPAEAVVKVGPRLT